MIAFSFAVCQDYDQAKKASNSNDQGYNIVPENTRTDSDPSDDTFESNGSSPFSVTFIPVTSDEATPMEIAASLSGIDNIEVVLNGDPGSVSVSFLIKL